MERLNETRMRIWVKQTRKTKQNKKILEDYWDKVNGNGKKEEKVEKNMTKQENKGIKPQEESNEMMAKLRNDRE